MNPRLRCTIGLMVLWATISTGSAVRALDEQTETSDEQIAEYVEQVTDGEADERLEATGKLIQLADRAIAPLAAAAETELRVESARCFDVLARLAASNDVKTADAAKEALNRLTDSDIAAVARRARTVLRLRGFLRQLDAQAKAAAPPTSRIIQVNSTVDGKTLQLERADDGSFSGKMTETVDGKDETNTIQAANEKELEEKFPDAYKAFRNQQEKEQQAGGVPLPGAEPAQRIAIGGNGGVNQTVQISVNNNKRTIQVKNGGEQVEIKDANGKDIEMKHTRLVDGKSKTDEYKAADLEDLKKKHPEAAKLYERHAGGNLIVGGGGGVGIQLQIGVAPGARPVRVAPLLIPPAPFPFNPGADFIPDQPAEPRTIRAEQEGRKIEIIDEDGKKIRVKISKIVDGKEAAQEFSAEDLKTLNAAHPEAAKLYEQYTGRKVD